MAVLGLRPHEAIVGICGRGGQVVAALVDPEVAAGRRDKARTERGARAVDIRVAGAEIHQQVRPPVPPRGRIGSHFQHARVDPERPRMVIGGMETAPVVLRPEDRIERLKLASPAGRLIAVIVIQIGRPVPPSLGKQPVGEGTLLDAERAVDPAGPDVRNGNNVTIIRPDSGIVAEEPIVSTGRTAPIVAVPVNLASELLQAVGEDHDVVLVRLGLVATYEVDPGHRGSGWG